MSKTERVGISLDERLLSQFDKLITNQNYTNRSEAIRDLIRKSLSEQELAKPTTKAVAGIFLVYDHHSMSLSQKLTDLQHHYLIQIISTIHVHLDHGNCLEIIILKGRVKDIENISNKIISLKGVKLSRVNVLTTGEKLT